MGMFTYVRARVWLGLLHRLSPFIAPSVTAVRVPSPGLLLLFAIRTLWVGCWFHLLVCLCVCVSVCVGGLDVYTRGKAVWGDILINCDASIFQETKTKRETIVRECAYCICNIWCENSIKGVHLFLTLSIAHFPKKLDRRTRALSVGETDPVSSAGRDLRSRLSGAQIELSDSAWPPCWGLYLRLLSQD